MIPISTSDLMFMFSGCDLTDVEQAHHPDNNLKLLQFLFMKTALTYIHGVANKCYQVAS